MNTEKNQADIYDQLHSQIYCDNAENLLEYINQNIKSPLKYVCDIGAGTGLLLSLLKVKNPSVNTILVEPSQSMVDQVYQLSVQPDQIFVIDGEQFAQSYQGEPLDLVILQGCVHFIKDFVDFLKRLKPLLSQNGKILISTRDKDCGFPLGKIMRNYFEESIPLNPNQIKKVSQELEYKVNLSKLRGDKVIEKELWLNIIKNNIRIISTIGKMSDSERKIELEDIAQIYQYQKTICFFDEVTRILIENK